MIVYFSGTGNSQHVALKLGEMLKEKVCKMESTAGCVPELAEHESLGIVFPVYAWGLPRIVEDWLSATFSMRKGNPGGMDLTGRYVWTVMTCGDDMGYTDKVLEKVLGRKVDACYSVQMPNTYVCLPGFDVDPESLAQRKETATNAALPVIADRLRRRESCRELTRGDMPWIKTYVLRPIFNKYLVTARYFHTNDRCTACGLCAKNCPLGEIAMNGGMPKWNDHKCTGCLRCYHSCPNRAIEWGRFTKGKGQKR